MNTVRSALLHAMDHEHVVSENPRKGLGLRPAQWRRIRDSDNGNRVADRDSDDEAQNLPEARPAEYVRPTVPATPRTTPRTDEVRLGALAPISPTGINRRGLGLCAGLRGMQMARGAAAGFAPAAAAGFALTAVPLVHAATTTRTPEAAGSVESGSMEICDAVQRAICELIVAPARGSLSVAFAEKERALLALIATLDGESAHALARIFVQLDDDQKEREGGNAHELVAALQRMTGERRARLHAAALRQVQRAGVVKRTP